MKKTSDQQKTKIDEHSEALKKQAEEWKNKYVRALADYQNLEKRTSERVSEVRQFAAEIILSRLLPVVDTFGKASKHIHDPGLALAHKELVAVLTEQGVERMDVLGRTFDPTQMDCVEVVEGKDDEVIEEVLPGYTFRGKVLRVARVKVGKSASQSS
jgi:molecular chaperone GrpE